jgi:hypothetical protein
LASTGESPGGEIIEIGPERRGVILSVRDISQGFASSTKYLLSSFGQTVVQAWSIQDESDNLAAIDPEDKSNKQIPYRTSAAFGFLPLNYARKLDRSI